MTNIFPTYKRSTESYLLPDASRHLSLMLAQSDISRIKIRYCKQISNIKAEILLNGAKYTCFIIQLASLPLPVSLSRITQAASSFYVSFLTSFLPSFLPSVLPFFFFLLSSCTPLNDRSKENCVLLAFPYF